MVLKVIYEHGVHENAPFADSYRNGTCHLVEFAEAGRSFFKNHLLDAGFDDDTALRICGRINRSDRTLTVWPKANLTALPRRYLRSATVTTDELNARLTEVFRVHCERVRSPHLVFNFTCAVLNKRRIEQIVKAAIRDEALVTGIQSVTIYFDHAESGIGPDDQPYEKSDAHMGHYMQVICFCPLCGGRIGESSLGSHMERRCHRRKTKPEPSPAPYGSPAAGSPSSEA